MEAAEMRAAPFDLVARNLYEAALVGDPNFRQHLDRPNILYQCCIQRSDRFTQSPLHVAADRGHLHVVTAILETMPDLAAEHDDKRGSTPLHLAAAKGHLHIVDALTTTNPGRNVCLEKDKDGRNPVHVAAMNGRSLVLCKMLEKMPQAAYERTSNGETVLHLCVKYHQMEALRVLVELTDSVGLLNATDSGGNTVLHLAVAGRQIEMLKFLLSDRRIEKNVTNANGYTAKDICRSDKHSGDVEIWKCLKKAKALSGKNAKRQQERDHSWSSSQYDALMVVASLIATMAFQVAMNPPGGVWQNNDTLYGVTTYEDPITYENQTITTAPGESVFGYIDQGRYGIVLIANAIAFASSVSVILILISGFQYNKYMGNLLTIIMWLSLSATTVTYWYGSYFVISSVAFLGDGAYEDQMSWSIKAWAILMGCVFIGYIIRESEMLEKSKSGQSRITKLRRLFGVGFSPCLKSPPAATV